MYFVIIKADSTSVIFYKVAVFSRPRGAITSFMLPSGSLV